MRVLVVSCVFPPEPVVSAQTSFQIAEELIQRGHEVRVITTVPSRPAGRYYAGYKRRLFQREQAQARFRIVRCLSIPSAESRLCSRFLENVSFGLTGGLAALTVPRPDVIYANTRPIFATGILFLVSKLRRVPLVISVQDVYPESLIAQQRMRPHNLMARWMRWLDGVIARGSQALIVISERFASVYRNERHVAPDRVYLVPNWMDSSLIVKDDQPDHFRSRKEIPHDAFVVAFGGNVGVAAGVETVIEAFQRLENARGPYLLVAGEGSQLADCQQLAREICEGRIVFHTPWLAQETSQVLRAADLLVLPTRGRQSLVSVPSKLVSYMLAARPVIALALPESDIAGVIEQSECGWIVPPDQPELLAAKIREIMEMDSRQLLRRGQAGRAFALKNLTREACLPHVVDVLEKASHDTGT
jgi:colanic acid biosynthesis glycosyl transferase WcaI